MNFRVLEKSIRVLEKSWKSPGNLFLKKRTNPVLWTQIFSLSHSCVKLISSLKIMRQVYIFEQIQS